MRHAHEHPHAHEHTHAHEHAYARLAVSCPQAWWRCKPMPVLMPTPFPPTLEVNGCYRSCDHLILGTVSNWAGDHELIMKGPWSGREAIMR